MQAGKKSYERKKLKAISLSVYPSYALKCKQTVYGVYVSFSIECDHLC